MRVYRSLVSQPSWLRGLKCLLSGNSTRLPPVAALVAAWIEIVGCLTSRSTGGVAALVAAWIEICSSPAPCAKYRVAALVAAWIEIGTRPLQPSRSDVAVLVAAWIEIAGVVTQETFLQTVAALVAAWIEMLYLLTLDTQGVTSQPPWLRGLKSLPQNETSLCHVSF